MKDPINKFKFIKMRYLVIIFIVLFVINIGIAQQLPGEVINTNEVIATGGDFCRGSHVCLSWTLGESAVETFLKNDIMLTQGFQQPIVIITAIDEGIPDKFQISIYPNPANEYFYLKFNANYNQLNGLKYDLYDLQGNIVITKHITSVDEKIDITSISSNMYLLRVYDEKGEFVRIFKIEKIE